MALAVIPLKRITLWLTIVALISNVYIFTYPSLASEQCSWKSDSSKGIPNLQGTSLWEKSIQRARSYCKDVWQEYFPKSSNGVSGKEKVSDIHLLALGDPQINGIWENTPYLSRLDIFGNDYYLGHIFRKMKSRLAPTHVAIMGDLFSSQWIGDSEFFNRTMRLTRRVLGRDGTSLSKIQASYHDEKGLYRTPWEEAAEHYHEVDEAHKRQAIWKYENIWAWNEGDNYLLINITGNHDVGYSGDCTYQHMSRYGQLFGSDNYWVEYDRDTDHPWRIVVLNDLLLDGPALQPEFVTNTWEFLHQLQERKFEGSTVLLTHIPFYKEAGLCFDGPEFNYYPEGYEREPYKSGHLRSQNHLSYDVSNRVLSMLFSNGKPGIILTGHDHEGCEVVYNQDLEKGTWNSSHTISSTNYVKEVTVRSMMGQYGGNTGLLTGRFSSDTKNWEWSYSLCPFAVQHIWWFTKVTTILAGLFATLAVFF